MSLASQISANKGEPSIFWQGAPRNRAVSVAKASRRSFAKSMSCRATPASSRRPPVTDSSHSRSVEDYLKAVYSLDEQGEAVGTNELARALDVQPASVSGMIRRLDEDGLVVHEPYRGVRLTAAGTAVALGVVRRHRVIESFLVQHLGFEPAEVHEEAERLEHAASDRLVERMARALDDPRTDPHGMPIPPARMEEAAGAGE